MKEIIKNNKAFFIPYLIFLSSGIVFFSALNKDERHLFLNQYHSGTLDVLFNYTTYLGEWIPPLAIGLFCLFVKYRYTIMLALGNLFSVIVTQSLKHTFDFVRPAEHFKGTDKLQFVDGVEMLYFNSFPSGHTTCAFTTFFFMALVTDSRVNKVLFFLIALAVGCSRVYLSQHFFDDIYVGSIVGVTCMLIVYYYIQRSKRPWLDKKIMVSVTP